MINRQHWKNQFVLYDAKTNQVLAETIMRVEEAKKCNQILINRFGETAIWINRESCKVLGS